MLIRSDIALIKYWFSVSDEEQERRFEDRIKDPTKRWKLSPMDIESRASGLIILELKMKCLNILTLKNLLEGCSS